MDKEAAGIIARVKNNTKDIFESVTVDYVLRDSAGKVLEKGDNIVTDLLPGCTENSYELVIDSSNGWKADLSKSTVKVKYAHRSSERKYKNVTKKVSCTYTRYTDSTVVNITLKNPTKQYVQVISRVEVYDKDGNLITVAAPSRFIKAGENESIGVTIYGEADRIGKCRVVHHAYTWDFFRIRY